MRGRNINIRINICYLSSIVQGSFRADSFNDLYIPTYGAAIDATRQWRKLPKKREQKKKQRKTEETLQLALESIRCKPRRIAILSSFLLLFFFLFIPSRVEQIEGSRGVQHAENTHRGKGRNKINVLRVKACD